MTRAAIKKRTPALMVGLRKYNDLCATLASMYNPEWAIPVPEPLPTELKLLREDPRLLQDVWISRPTDKVPRWLQDPNLCEAIRARLKLDRCQEEQQRLQDEAVNLAQWHGRELAAVELALQVPTNYVDYVVPSPVFEDQNQAAYVEDEDPGDDIDEMLNPQAEYLITEDVLLGDYWAQEVEHVVSEPESAEQWVASPGVDIDLVWEIPVDVSVHYNLLDDLNFQTFEEFAPLSHPRILGNQTVLFEDEQAWTQGVRSAMVWIAPTHGSNYQHDRDVLEWESFMTLNVDRLRRRTKYYAFARLGTYLRGPQYSHNIISLAERGLIERSNEEVFQFLVNKLEGSLWGDTKLTPETKLYLWLVETLETNLWGAGRDAFEASGKELEKYIVEHLAKEVGNA
ncbi:hypothetical protein C0991_001573 [Blastosporella zonata]|nr:hypothetical protein C0991_001573 [Blastosporella zonata]